MNQAQNTNVSTQASTTQLETHQEGHQRARQKVNQRTKKSMKMHFKQIATWGVVLGTALWATFFYVLILISIIAPQLIPDSWFIQLLKDHPAGTIGIAMSAVSAFSVVVVLGVFRSDPIEIKILGIELKGSAGPVVLWVLCFLAMAVAGKLLW